MNRTKIYKDFLSSQRLIDHDITSCEEVAESVKAQNEIKQAMKAEKERDLIQEQMRQEQIRAEERIRAEVARRQEREERQRRRAEQEQPLNRRNILRYARELGIQERENRNAAIQPINPLSELLTADQIRQQRVTMLSTGQPPSLVPPLNEIVISSNENSLVPPSLPNPPQNEIQNPFDPDSIRDVLPPFIARDFNRSFGHNIDPRVIRKHQRNTITGLLMVLRRRRERPIVREVIENLGTFVDFRGRPVTQETFDRLTEIVYKKHDATKEETKEENETPLCSVCHCQFAEGDVMKQLPCNHQFHKACIEPWFERNDTCPICRLQLQA
ncbi:hypothetical protein FGO68_gene4262 [Halteria grandinella]|uniref:RING-type domain-containing protein n=1 Tax=Halteria grandinella TaxID=5974 RepID=A0A8J8NQ45_HALGN|nr:hypothetical protein FGO68_gene4262 [Halteria grandinella]